MVRKRQYRFFGLASAQKSLLTVIVYSRCQHHVHVRCVVSKTAHRQNSTRHQLPRILTPFRQFFYRGARQEPFRLHSEIFAWSKCPKVSAQSHSGTLFYNSRTGVECDRPKETREFDRNLSVSYQSERDGQADGRSFVTYIASMFH